MHAYQSRFVDYCLQRGALKFGEFTLKSGRVSPYFFNAGIFNRGADLAALATKVRNLRHHGFEEGVSTRLLVYAAQLVARDIPVRRACEVAISTAISDDPEVQRAVSELVSTLFP